MEYKLITERSHLYAPNIHVLFIVELCKAIDTAVLREAIKKVLQKYPILRSSIHFDESGNAYYHIEDYIEPDFCVEEITDNRSWISTAAHEQERPFILGRAPLIRFTCLKDDNKMQLMMCVHHIIADGLSCVRIIQDIMTFVQNPEQSVDVQKVYLLEDSELYNKEKLALPIKLLVNWLNKQWRKSPYIFSEEDYYTMRQNYWRKRNHTICVTKLNKSQTEKLIEVCKKNRVTVNTMLITTLLETAQKIDKRNKKAGIAASIHSNGMNMGNFASGVSLEYVYDTSKSIWDNAAFIQEHIKKKQNNIRLKYFFLSFLKALDVNLIDSMYFDLFGDFRNKATNYLKSILEYKEKPIGLGISNLGKTELSAELGIKTAYFIPPLIANTDKIVGFITTASGLNIVYQYSNQINTEVNRQIFEAWINRLKIFSYN